jgi:para-aminobenzoate synthetase / 4-amino-4-deoxychorismate lyase
MPALRRIGREVEKGWHAAGFVAYEAAPAMDGALAVLPPLAGLPLLRFGIYTQREEIAPLAGLGGAAEVYEMGRLTASTPRARYERAVLRTQELIAAGDTYQVNLTFRLRGSFSGSAPALYRHLCRAQRAGFCALLETDRHTIVSASPELFFRRRGQALELRPMKGTRRRGRWSAEDDEIARELAAAEKDRAENLMIVDLLRNDLGRVAEFGSVRVPALFAVERYPTVHQMTSTVTGRLRPGVGLAEIFQALFPSGSVTGAPKIRTSEIIRGLEDSPRGPYTGAIGFASGDEAVFSVAIRTLLIDRELGSVEIGVGSGITADSRPAAERRECFAKAAFVRAPAPDFELLESLRLEPSGEYPRIERHLARMRASASYFGFPFEQPKALRTLARARAALGGAPFKVRLLLNREGDFRVQRTPIPQRAPPARLTLARAPVDPGDPFLYHKTTHPSARRAALRLARPGEDVVLFNRRGELTETDTANLVLRIEGELLTPAIDCGLLPGTLREVLLEERRIRACTLRVADLERAQEIYLINSVRGWREAVRPDPPGTDRPQLPTLGADTFP